MTNTVATPQCFVEIYPFEGGEFEITAGQVLQCKVEKSLRGKGTFQIELAPGGPFGPNTFPSWTEIVTPMSFVLIGLTRWAYREIVMIGVVTQVIEDQAWTDDGVHRSIVVTGEDFGYFFESFNWCSLSFLAGATAAVGQAVAGTQNAGLPAVLSGALLSGTPDQVAQDWYDKVMAGTNGILSQTTLAYGGDRIAFPDVVSTLFEPYPGFTIPFGDSFVTDEGTWMSKFRQILPFPWYEFFVITEPQGMFGDAGAFNFTMRGVGEDRIATVAAVGRINPVPVVTTQGAGQSMLFTGIDTSNWEGLTLYQPDSGFIEHAISFDAAEARNFYVLNPVWSKLLFGQNNTSLMPFILSFVGAFDPDSIHRYGFHPEYATTRWMADLQGTAAQNANNDTFNNMIADLTSRVFSFYHPTPLMARASVLYPLRPDIFPGQRFTYSPFKADEPWEFYIDGIEHNFVFGVRSTTRLSLSRGLPSAIYAEGGGIEALLTKVILGQAQRINGAYHVNLSGTGQKSFGITDANNVAADIAKVYVQAQKS